MGTQIAGSGRQRHYNLLQLTALVLPMHGLNREICHKCTYFSDQWTAIIPHGGQHHPHPQVYVVGLVTAVCHTDKRPQSKHYTRPHLF